MPKFKVRVTWKVVGVEALSEEAAENSAYNAALDAGIPWDEVGTDRINARTMTFDDNED
jgi:hypothetical protein